MSFREVAAEAAMSVALVQHYFGSKENLLVGSLDIHSARLAQRLADRVTPAVEAWALLSLVLGLSLAVLLDQRTPGQAMAVLDMHIEGLRP